MRKREKERSEGSRLELESGSFDDQRVARRGGWESSQSLL